MLLASLSPGDAITFTGVPAEDLTYMDHLDNSTTGAVARSWTLAVGNYTIVLGSNSPSATSPPRQGFAALFATPEPGRATLVLFAAMSGLMRRRRR